MDISHLAKVACISIALGGAVHAQPATQPTTTLAASQIMMPAVRYQNAPLDEILNSLRDKVPSFNFTVVRAPGVPAGYPMIGDLNAKNVTVDQFLQFIEATFGVGTVAIDGPAGPLYVLSVRQPDGDAVEQARLKTRSVQIFPLSVIISALRVPDAKGVVPANKQLMNDVLSLVQAAVKEAGAEKDISLQAHEPTATLLVNGNQSQLNLVQLVLDALRPSQESLTAMNARLEAQLAESRGIAGQSQNIQRQLQMEIDRLQRQLSAAAQSSTTRPKE